MYLLIFEFKIWGEKMTFTRLFYFLQAYSDLPCFHTLQTCYHHLGPFFIQHLAYILFTLSERVYLEFHRAYADQDLLLQNQHQNSWSCNFHQPFLSLQLEPRPFHRFSYPFLSHQNSTVSSGGSSKLLHCLHLLFWSLDPSPHCKRFCTVPLAWFYFRWFFILTRTSFFFPELFLACNESRSGKCPTK